MSILINVSNILLTIHMIISTASIFFLTQGILSINTPYLPVFLDLWLFTSLITLIVKLLYAFYFKNKTLPLSLLLNVFWGLFVKTSGLEIFMINDVYRLQFTINSITIGIIAIYLYQNLRNSFSVFSQIKISFRLLITLSFLLVIGIGTILLMLPIATPPQAPKISLINAFFTSVSAVCVTGLTVVDTATYFSRFGQIVIIILIQIGSLGLVTITTTMIALLGRKLSLIGQLSAKNSVSASDEASLSNYLFFTLGFTLLIEIIIALTMFTKFYQFLPFREAVFYSVFHAISSFCNAGFSLFSNSLIRFQSDPIINFSIMISIIIGGLGFRTWLDIKNKLLHKDPKPLSFQTVISLQASVILIITGTIGFFILEQSHSLKNLTISNKIMAALFASVNFRTAGFNTIDLSVTTEASRLFSLFFMYIGASPGSTGGGIKTTTFFVLLAYTKASFYNSNNFTILGKRINDSLILQAWFLVVHSALWIFTVTVLLCYFDNIPLSAAIFETVSAYGTVGVSIGITPSLSIPSKILIASTMILGRIGPATIMFALLKKNKISLTKTPPENLSIG